MESWIKVNQMEKNMNDFKMGPIELEFESGMIHVIVGGNGSGKSTLFKQIMNLVTFDAGSIEVFGSNVAGEDEGWKKRIAYQPQTLVGCDEFTGRQLMQLISPLYPNWNQSLFDDIARSLSVPLNKKFGKLSQGVQQKLAIALTLARDTDILLLDEPTSHMDIPAKSRVMDLFVEWMERGEKLIILSSHQTEDIRKLADYLLFMSNGKLHGKFVKDELVSSFKKYWLEKELSSQIKLPGEIDRKNNRLIVTNDAEKAEAYLLSHKIGWIEAESLEMDEVISYMVVNKNGGVL
ncbi:ABC-2 type transport system ATP-binding protein [Cytobacillus horneckiae]|uniref:ABC transporter ATP-binding protein n=1 Tax=Cytobacillus horneckiae TaxID=549687 RepID=A0A2N0ZJQ3_9BACI|nr:ABC transporter ATP-binding protein [Cytobacillus horneckiae]MBN6888593.1 ABC transporter ATP-binding protein [Cytobacillus horneckiae]MEC1158873.1 ABC transporter ATP-binding protein [Cytobacillus horneckiae]MED2938706.1 ABC transporter ATP-binding protein [Cytobacillus horneckiae]PKG29747.1 ABC transporter ATP-binding protein [Cytobacillus horneckiae]